MVQPTLDAIPTPPPRGERLDRWLNERICPSRLVSLGAQCDALQYVFYHADRELGAKVRRRGSVTTWQNPSDWLHFAASIVDVTVDSSRFAEYPFMCGTAADAVDRHSDFQRQVAHELIVFNLIWGSLESVLKLVKTPKVPRSLCANPTELDQLLYGLKIKAPGAPTIAHTTALAGVLFEALRRSPQYEEWHARASRTCYPHIGPEGFGLQIVRQIRNSFAHGAADLGFVDDETDDGVPELARIIHCSSRIALLAQQAALLLLATETHGSVVTHGSFPETAWHGERLESAVRSLHIEALAIDDRQAWLWPDLSPQARAEVI